MSPGDRLRELRVLAAHRARIALTLLGIVIGSGSVVFIAALVQGGEGALVRTNQRATDAALISVSPQAPPAAVRHRTTRPLSRWDGAELASSEALGGAWVGSESSRQTRAFLLGPAAIGKSRGERSRRITLVSASTRAPELYRLRLAEGRFFDEVDLRQRRRIAVVGREVADKLFPGQRLDHGVSIEIDGEVWTVVGVLAEKPMLGSTDGTNIWNRKVLVPETTFAATLSTGGGVSRLFARSVGRPVSELRNAADGLLLRRHLGVRNFEVDDPAKRSEERTILAVVRLLLIGTGVLSLFVGGINVANVMLVAVTERTREIGLRRALGATRGSIVAQFLLEAAALATTGGLVGVAAGALLAAVVGAGLGRWLGEWDIALQPWAIGSALGAALVTGLLAGVAPALRAARIDPIRALAFE